MLDRMLSRLRSESALVHCITNYVTVNDVANILLASGGSPIMADDKDEVEEITSLCSALCINIGTLNERTIESMKLAGKKAKELGHPVVLDPVGAGASRLRTSCAQELLEGVRPTVIRGNISEIKALGLGTNTTQGVDASLSDCISEERLSQYLELAQEFARRTGACVVITGPIDIVCDAHVAYCVYNGHPLMSSVTGTGCQLSALLAAFVSANPDKQLEACLAAVCSMGLAGEKAFARMGELDGNASYRGYIIDAIYKMSPEDLLEGARYERR